MRKPDISSLAKELAILLIFTAVFTALVYTEQIGRWIDSTILSETQSQLQQILEVAR